ncbi:MAG: hypothetical protein ACQEQO_12480, partial [Thermodesulfobacteriota bacterium]
PHNTQRPLKNPAIFTLLKKTMDFFEVTGGFRLDSVLEGTPPRKVEPPARREGCCLFVTYQWGNPQAPINRDLRDIVSPKGQSLLCVPCGFVIYGKQREILKIARLFKGLILGEKPFF